MLSCTLFIRSLTNKIYKMLPLRESEISRDRTFLTDYINSIFIEATGAMIIFEGLKLNEDYITVVSILGYINKFELPLKSYKREVFKMLNLLNKIENRLSGDISD